MEIPEDHAPDERIRLPIKMDVGVGGVLRVENGIPLLVDDQPFDRQLPIDGGDDHIVFLGGQGTVDDEEVPVENPCPCMESPATVTMKVVSG